jgi:molybdopterin/thiamine biosynthesis adenylyltransferase
LSSAVLPLVVDSVLARKSALLVGVGGLGSSIAIALARAGVGTLGVADDDEVETSNLHRQILFTEADVGLPKTTVAARAVAAWAGASPVRVVVHGARLLPGNAVDLVSRYDVVVEGSDNFATKFLTADACAIAKVAVVHGAAVKWLGTAFAVGPYGRPCYRCLFEDLPREHAPGCSEAGVLGPVVGIVGAVQADLALAMLHGRSVAGTLVTFDGKSDRMRRRVLAWRPSCELCGASPKISKIDATRYLGAECDTSPASVAS